MAIRIDLEKLFETQDWERACCHVRREELASGFMEGRVHPEQRGNLRVGCIVFPTIDQVQLYERCTRRWAAELQGISDPDVFASACQETVELVA
jgi:hypothetical protein